MKAASVKKSVLDVELKDKRVFLRADFNVPITSGKIQDDYKIRATIPTIEYILDKSPSRLVIGSHLGRPRGKPLTDFSLRCVLDHLNLYSPVKFVIKGVGDDLGASKFILFENLRFYPEEEEGYGDYFVQNFELLVIDAFGCIHRHARSIVDTQLLSVMGLLLKKELEMAKKLEEGVDLCVLGGSKVVDKLQLVVNLKKKAKKVWIVGAMCFTVLKDGYGVHIGSSRYEENAPVRAILGDKEPSLPVDFVVRKEDTYEMVDYISEGQVGVDIGKKTLRMIESDVFSSKSVFWNGPPGIFEKTESSEGTQKLVDVLMQFCKKGGTCIVGGGDTASAVKKFGAYDAFTHVSTGGGSFIALLEGRELPGIDALSKKP